MTKRPRTLKSIDDFIAAGLVDASNRASLAEVADRYALALTPAVEALIDKNDPTDPIAAQYVPDVRELVRTTNEMDDPIGDELKSPVPGLVHRYPDRVLIKLVAICAVYCRFCFRREMVGPGEKPMSAEDVARALHYVLERPKIWEVVFTGGDPFMLSPRRIAETSAVFAAINHVKVMRWHTRLPVVDPAAISVALAQALTAGHQKAVVVAVHANHAKELTKEARSALARLRRAGVALISQSVLLKGVNDDVDVLESLMRAFVEAGVKPYYLHHPDLAPGTSHRRPTIAEGRRLTAELRTRISGLAMPSYVLDVPGAHGKVHLDISPVDQIDDDTYKMRQKSGEIKFYRD